MNDGLLIDSNAFLWWLTGDRRLGEVARRVIEEAEAPLYLSAVTPWELQIKRAKHHDEPWPLRFVEDAGAAGFEFLPITPSDGIVAGALPLHHHDPFDRMLVAQCMRRDLALVTSDAMMRRYDIPVFPATA